MKLLVKFNIIYILVMALGVGVSGYITRSLLQEEARQETINQARLLIDKALAVRAYTSGQISKLLETQMKYEFLPQSVPSYSAVEVLSSLQSKYPDFFYKEATLNPTNPRDRASGWEVDIVNQFRNSADQKLKRPAEFVASLLRVTGATTVGNFYRPLTDVLTTLGQVPYGWPAPNGYPDMMGYWISTTSVLSRWNVVFDLLEGRLAPALRVDLAALLGSAASPDAIVDQLAGRLLRRPLAEADRAQFVAVAAGNSLPQRPLPDGLRWARARDVAALMLTSPYFQYR